MLVLLGACSQQDVNEAKNEETLKDVTIMLDWFPNTNHTGIYVAIENGYYKEQGLNVKIQEPGEGVSAEQVVASGKADFAVSYQESLTQARSTGIPLVSVAAIIQENTSAFASLKEANIQTPKDFEGKRYGGWGSPTEEAVLKALSDNYNIDYSKIEQVTLGQTDFFQSIGRDADFEWIYYGWDGVEADRQGIELNYIFLKDIDESLNYYTPIIVTSEDHINEDADMVKAFIEATTKGYEYAIEKPEEAANILLKHVPDLNEELVLASQKWLSNQYKGNAEQWGIQKQEVWQRYADWMFEQGLIETNIEAEKAFTNEFLLKGNE
ncbi:ABC transporter substrate-binding protein [Bacillus sp. FJAT-47783]|uniref:ABC transporter substrate-binding protein n=1 Tax=Bacillus sp. FJAT-47783 TaxID=2922712 RepID=UPI001FAE4D8B|nr:ABC transporter substrate-binding protein [Bacillus sp. FJAT-47783]